MTWILIWGSEYFSVLSGDQIEKMAHKFLGSVAILPSSHKNGRRPMMMSCCSSFLTSLPPSLSNDTLVSFFSEWKVMNIFIYIVALSDCPIPLYCTLRKTHPLKKGSPKLIMNEPWFLLSLLTYTCMWSYIVLSSFMLFIFTSETVLWTSRHQSLGRESYLW